MFLNPPQNLITDPEKACGKARGGRDNFRDPIKTPILSLRSPGDWAPGGPKHGKNFFTQHEDSKGTQSLCRGPGGSAPAVLPGASGVLTPVAILVDSALYFAGVVPAMARKWRMKLTGSE